MVRDLGTAVAWPLPLLPGAADACLCRAPVAKIAPKTRVAAFSALRRARSIFGVLLIPPSKLTASYDFTKFKRCIASSHRAKPEACEGIGGTPKEFPTSLDRDREPAAAASSDRGARGCGLPAVPLFDLGEGPSLASEAAHCATDRLRRRQQKGPPGVKIKSGNPNLHGALQS